LLRKASSAVPRLASSAKACKSFTDAPLAHGEDINTNIKSGRGAGRVTPGTT
jgi:hypothetical protein